MPLEIPSFFQDGEAEALAGLARGRMVLELGSYKGGSAVLMARAGARMVHSVDWHTGDPHLRYYQDTLATMWHNLMAADVRRQVVLHVGRFQDVLPLFRPQSFELIFVDGCHDYDAVKRDLEMVLPLLCPSGVLACHDYGRWGVRPAVQEACKQLGVKEIELVHSLAILRLGSQ